MTIPGGYRRMRFVCNAAQTVVEYIKQLFSGEGGAFCMPNIIEITDFHAPELDLMPG